MCDIFRNNIYYLYDLHKTCEYICRYGETDIDKYINFVNKMLCIYFTYEQQKQLKLNDFDKKLLEQIAYQDLPENISFDGIDENKLYYFFDKICIMDIQKL